MAEHHIFTFWEPHGALLPYLDLCRQTWSRHLAAFEIALIDYGNLAEYLEPGTYEIPLLQTFPIHVQKDAVMVAVLRRHGGVFMDLDTLVLGDVSPLLHSLATSEVVLFDSHLAFVAARPQARILSLWEEAIQRRLAELRQSGGSGNGASWNTLGNSLLSAAMDDVARSTWPWLKVPQRLAYRRQRFLFRTVCRKYLCSLSRRAYGFIAEANHYGRDDGDPAAAYRRFWFEESLTPEVVLRPGRMIVGLHNSWTPDWYKQLSAQEVLAHSCLLSRTLRCLLAGC